MDYKKCCLYGLKSQRQLAELFKLGSKDFFKAENFKDFITPFICKETVIVKGIEKIKCRLVEAPNKELKRVQKRLLSFLQKLEYPPYVFSGIKKRGYIDNGRLHEGKKYVYKIDLSKFFPSVSRNKVYYFFRNKLAISQDVANILTNICTIDYRFFTEHENYGEAVAFIQSEKITENAHLTTGSPVSTILSYLVNIDMFDKLSEYCERRGIVFSIYIDDMTFSSYKFIGIGPVKFISNTIREFRYKLSKHKSQYYMPYMSKEITGTVIDKDGNIKTPNKLIHKTHERIKLFKDNENDDVNLQALRGCVVAANSIDGKFSSLRKVVYKKKLSTGK